MNDTPTLSNTPRTYMAAAQSFDRLMQESEQLERELAQSQADTAGMRAFLEQASDTANFASSGPFFFASVLIQKARNIVASTTAGADILERLRKAEDIIENAKSAFGEHPDSDIDLAQRISELRDDARKPFHDMTKLMNERDSLRDKHAFSLKELARGNEIIDALRIERDALRKQVEGLKDPATVNVNILRGAIALPDDYYREHDTNGPLAQARAEIERLKEDNRALQGLLMEQTSRPVEGAARKEQP